MTSIRTVILFVVDGLTPEALRRANVPAMRALMERGAHTLAARSVMPSITLPAHMSMFHGVDAETHAVTTNEWRPRDGTPIPGIVDLVRREGRKAAIFYTWEELRDLWRPGAAAFSVFINIYGPQGEQSDALIARMAADYLASETVDFAFVYLGLVDEIGHRHGWLSPQYLSTVEGADAALAAVLARLEAAGRLENTTCLLTADHGGHDRSHGSDQPEDMTVPWILAGPGARIGKGIAGPVSIMDTAPTIAHLLGLPIPPEWQGAPVFEALEDGYAR